MPRVCNSKKKQQPARGFVKYQKKERVSAKRAFDKGTKYNTDVEDVKPFIVL
jgi:hypothetical protein